MPPVGVRVPGAQQDVLRANCAHASIAQLEERGPGIAEDPRFGSGWRLQASRPGGRVSYCRIPGSCCRGKSGLHRARWSVTPTRGDPRESATESKPPRASMVRVKRWCKRPPAPRVTGAARQAPPGARPRSWRAARPMPAGRPLEAASNDGPRWMAAARSGGYRTRLTGRLANGKRRRARSGLRTSYGRNWSRRAGPLLASGPAALDRGAMRTWPRWTGHHVANVKIAGSSPVVRSMRSWRNGIRAGFRPRWPARAMRVQVSPSVRNAPSGPWVHDAG